MSFLFSCIPIPYIPYGTDNNESSNGFNWQPYSSLLDTPTTTVKVKVKVKVKEIHNNKRHESKKKSGAVTAWKPHTSKDTEKQEPRV